MSKHGSFKNLEYTHDVMSDMMAMTETITSTVAIAYFYNSVNQLVTAQRSDEGVTWFYTHDQRGNLVRQTPGGTEPAEGETRYTYDGANQLVRVELYTSGAYVTLAEGAYNGDGERVRLIAWAAGTPLTVTYGVFQGQILATDDDAQTTLHLYGRGFIGECRIAGWAYHLRDGEGSVRQIVDESGAVTLARTYKPFGGVLQEQGQFETVFGFLGAQLDRISGLMYIGGRYYDPATGRFLTPEGGFDPYNPRTLNPYMPWQNPGLWLMAPLAVLAALRMRRKGKGRRYDHWLVLLLVVGIGMSAMACGGEDGGGTQPPTPPQTPGGDTGSPGGEPGAGGEMPTPGPSPLPTDTPTPTPCPPTPTPPPPGSTVYITIDDGPGGYTSQVLNTLAQYQAKATFFLTGNRIQSHPDEVRRMKNDGHAIGTHSWDHSIWRDEPAERQKEEIQWSQEALMEVTGERSNLFRAPGGDSSAGPNGAVPDNPELFNYNWTVDTNDWKLREAENAALVSKIVFQGDDTLVPGSEAVAIDNNSWSGPIILIHSIHPVDPPALDLILQGLIERGYTFGVLPRPGDSPGTGPIWARD